MADKKKIVKDVKGYETAFSEEDIIEIARPDSVALS